MKRPWQIWIIFGVSVAVIFTAMGWLTWKALELNRKEEATRRELESARRAAVLAHQQTDLARQHALAAQQRVALEGRISSALWRMDTTLIPLLAQEVAHPYYFYHPFYATAGGGKGAKLQAREVASPLLVQPSDHVLLHFQIEPNGRVGSPQSPSEAMIAAATQRGVPASSVPKANIDRSRHRLTKLSAHLNYQTLCDRLPADLEPSERVAQLANNQANSLWNNRLNLFLPNSDPPVISNRSKAKLSAGQNSPSQIAQQPQQAGNDSPRQIEVEQQQKASEPFPAQQALQGAQQGFDLQPAQAEQEFEAGLLRRDRAVQFYAQNAVRQQRLITALDEPPQPPLGLTLEATSQPLWIGENLILARRVAIGKQQVIQGCWLDWATLKNQLLTEIRDLLPSADLLPIADEEDVPPNRRLATLPVKLLVSEPELRAKPLSLPIAKDSPSHSLSSIQASLWMAWGCLLLTTVAVGGLLKGVMALSERRASFVAAVTHELRTPLTTFRMYAEMLAENMVPDEKRQKQYMETLRVESDRLSHLVENVLQYARLERGRGGRKRETVSIRNLLDRVVSRLEDRAQQAEMKLVVAVEEEASSISINTDPSAVEQILFNLVDNAGKYATLAADRRIQLEVHSTLQTIEMRLQDHGPGISPSEANRLFRPFSKSVHQAAASAPGVGLGLALSRRLARALGGQLRLDCGSETGALFVLTLPRSG